MKEKWFNYRPICVVFMFLLLGSIFSFYITRNIAITLTTSIIFACILILSAILKKRVKYLLVPIISFIVGIGAYYLAVYNFNKTIDYTPQTIQARICNISNEESGMIKVHADKCV